MIELTRRDKRREDVIRLKKEVKKFFKIGGFDWQRRYDAVYLCQYARQKKWQLSRLTKAVGAVDLEYRLAVNREKRKNEEGR